MAKHYSIALTVALLTLAACGEKEVELDGKQAVVKSNPSQSAPKANTKVQLATLFPQALIQSYSASGVVEAAEEVTLTIDFNAIVKQLFADEGQAVVEGQKLAALDAQKRELAASQAKQMLAQAQAAVDEARLDLNRRQSLAANQTVSKETLDKARLAVDRTQAAYLEAEATRDLAARELADSTVLAPVSGVIDKRQVEAGETVLAGQPLFTLQTVSALRANVWVGEAIVGKIRVGTKAEVYFPSSDQSQSATVESVAINAHPKTGNYAVKLVIGNAAGIRPGMTVKATIQGEVLANALVLPAAALIDRDRKKVVLKVTAGKAEQVEPKLQPLHDGNWLVVEGLLAEDQVIVAGQLLVVDGASVKAAK